MEYAQKIQKCLPAKAEHQQNARGDKAGAAGDLAAFAGRHTAC